MNIFLTVGIIIEKRTAEGGDNMMKYIMTAMIILAVIFGLISGNISEVSRAFLEECSGAVELAFSLIGVICLWSGIMNAAQGAGLTEKLAGLFSPVLSRLFKGLKKGGRAMQFISLNITANLLGLGNASTPFGISAMKEIEAEEKSKTPEKASHNMILLTVMNTASLQIIPATVAAIRLRNGSEAPMEILPCVWIVSALSLTAALLGASFFKKLSGKRL